MQIAAGVVTLLNLVLCCVVAVRLAVLGRNTQRAPEICLAVYFAASAVVATVAQVIVYASWADPALQVSDAVARPLLAVAISGMALGASAVAVFTWRTFRPQSRAGAAGAAAVTATLAIGLALEAVREGFAPVIFAGAGHWVGWAGRSAAMLWLAIESLRYHALLRKRLRLGLADPVVANRFLLWGVWSVASFLNFVADLGARGIYVLATGTTTEVVPSVMASVVAGTILTTMALGVVSAVTLFLTFFPTAGYRRWLEVRAASQVG